MSLCSCNIHVYFRSLYTNQLVLFCHEFCQPNQHNICSTSLSSPSQLWKNHWMACHYPKSPNSAAKKKWDCFLYKILINVSNIKHCIWPHDHMCISEYSARHFINNSPTISKSRLINVLWLNIIENTFFIDLDSSLEEQYGFLKGLNLFFFESSWTYGKISLVALNQVSQFVQKSSPVWCIHCSPRTAQFEGLLGCFYSDINVCLDIRFKATSIKFEFKIHASCFNLHSNINVYQAIQLTIKSPLF